MDESQKVGGKLEFETYLEFCSTVSSTNLLTPDLLYFLPGKQSNIMDFVISLWIITFASDYAPVGLCFNFDLCSIICGI